jgi:hypothetical protein
MTGEQCALDHAGVPSEATHRCAPAATDRGRLARPLEMEHVCVPDREAMLAALRVALGLPRVLPNEREADR